MRRADDSPPDGGEQPLLQGAFNLQIEDWDRSLDRGATQLQVNATAEFRPSLAQQEDQVARLLKTGRADIFQSVDFTDDADHGGRGESRFRPSRCKS